MDTILLGQQITRRFPLGRAYFEVLKGVDLTVTRGEFVGVMGPSGCGKSTLLHILGGLDTPTGGRVTIEGTDIVPLSERTRTLLRREKTGFVFQAFNLIPTLSAYENVALPLLIAGKPVDRYDDRLAEIITLMGLVHVQDHKPDQLSAGEQQRVAIGRALLPNPSILFADEPTGNLDYTTGLEVMELLWESCTRLGQTIVLATHDAQAAAFADRVVVLHDGVIQKEIRLGRRSEHSAGPLIAQLQRLGL
ncbi:MAG TPA: ABC transporter ATP-binding protein [Chloroflexi bacterium]|nr:ABC transporter ATP-binding protein [Chloroflexota bacterium]